MICLFLVFVVLSNIFATIEINILLGKQFDGHVVHWIHLFLQNDSIEECIDASITLHEGMLGNQERDAALTYAFRILGYHIVAHNLDVATVASQQVFTN
jgi:hypothetical protein